MSSVNHDCDANDDDDDNDSINNNNNNQLLHSLSSNVCLFPFIFSCTGCLNKHTLLSKRCLFLLKLLAC